MSRPVSAFTVVLCQLFSVLLFGAGPNLVSPDSNKYVLYHFIRQAAYLSRKADMLDQTEGSGDSLRSAFSSTLGLSDADATVVLSLANELDAQFAALDKQAATIIADAKAQRPAEGLIPPPPSELAELQKQKMALMNALGMTVTQRLRPDVISAIETHLRRMSNHPVTQAGSGPAQ
jgi:hypothetical protein